VIAARSPDQFVLSSVGSVRPVLGRTTTLE